MEKDKKIKPQVLRPGDTVAVVVLSAPEAALNPDNFKMGISYLKNKGYNVLIAPHALNRKGYMVADPNIQANDLGWAFSNDEIKAIFLAGGGYNANRLLPLIDYNLIRKNPKIIIGMSNMCVILNAIWSKTKLVTFYGPSVIWNLGSSEGIDPYSESLLWKALSYPEPIGEIPILTEREVISHGKAKGLLIGGNLTSLESLLGTPYEPDWTEAIFFWEDCFMEFHAVDMILTHFALSGVFNKISGMIIGRPLEIQEKEFAESPSLPEIISDICGRYKLPILYNVDFGHNIEKATLPIGVKAEVDSTNKQIKILESGVEL